LGEEDGLIIAVDEEVLLGSSSERKDGYSMVQSSPDISNKLVSLALCLILLRR